MSLRCMTWVFHESPVEGFERLVLLAIADEADDDGHNAFPSQRRIAKKARVGVSTIPQVLRRLEAAGALTVNRPGTKGRGHFNRYSVIMPERLATRAFQSQETRGKTREDSRPLPDPALTLRPLDPKPPAVLSETEKQRAVEAVREVRKALRSEQKSADEGDAA